MFMPGGGGRKCAAASHTSRPVPTLDRISDVAHCAQNFGQNAKLTISLSNTRHGRRAVAEDGRRATNIKPAGIGGRGIEASRHREAVSLSLWRGLSPASFRGREIRPRHDTVAGFRVPRLGWRGNQNKPIRLAITHPVKTPSVSLEGVGRGSWSHTYPDKRLHPSGDHCASRCHSPFTHAAGRLPDDICGLPGPRTKLSSAHNRTQCASAKAPVGDLNNPRQPMRRQSQNWASRLFASGEGWTPFGSSEKGSAVAPSM